MINLDRFPDIWAYYSVDSPRSKANLDNNIRQYDKILLEATDQSSKYIAQRNKLGSSFEALLRSVGLGVGVVFGGPVGAATLSSIAGGVGRGVGEYLGNRIYGETINDLEKTMTEHKYKQLQNFTARSNVKASLDLNDEFYKQAQAEENRIIQDLNS